MVNKKTKHANSNKKILSYEDEILIPITLEETPYEAYILIKKREDLEKPSSRQVYVPAIIPKYYMGGKDYVVDEIKKINKQLKINNRSVLENKPSQDPPNEPEYKKTILDIINKKGKEIKREIQNEVQNALKDLEKKMDEKINLILEEIKKQKVLEESQNSLKSQTGTQQSQEEFEKIASEYVVSKKIIESDEDFKEYLDKTKKIIEDVKSGKIDIKKLLEYMRNKIPCYDFSEVQPYMPIIIAAVKNSIELKEEESDIYPSFCNILYNLSTSDAENFKNCSELYKICSEGEEN
ncbi:MAG: hypothetical protein QW423_00385 [Candidatus Aenigmatarchaeota archaeon]